MAVDFSKPLTSQQYFVQQIQLEQQFLLLNENQRDILSTLLSTERAMTEYELRMRTYHRLIVEAVEHSKYSIGGAAIYDINKKFEEWELEPIVNYGGRGREEEDNAAFVEELERKLKNGLKVPFKDLEKFLRFLAKEFRVNLPSNAKFRNALRILPFEGVIIPHKKEKPKHVEYSLNENFFAQWKRIRQSILQEAEKGNISLKYLTDASKEFWQIKES